jgi:hypothetical protein
MLQRMGLIDPALHVILGLVFVAAFWLSPGVGVAAALWVREAAQRNPHDMLDGLDVRAYSPQKHLEIWPPALVVELILRYYFT